MHEIQLKPTEAEFKVAVIAGADRLNAQAANAFLKTLEEPPPNSILILLSTEPSADFGNDFVALPALEFLHAKAPARSTRRKRSGWQIRRARGRRSRKACWAATACSTCCCKNSAKSGRAWMKRSPRVRRWKNTTRWKKICARNGRTNLTAGIEAEYRRHRADLLLLRAMVAARCVAAHAGRRQGTAAISRKFPARRLSPGGFRRARRWKICRRWSRRSGCCTPTCRRRSRWKSAC